MTHVAAAPAREPEHDAVDPLPPPPGHQRFPLVDGLRFIAVLGVVLDHVNERTHPFGIHTYGDRVLTAAGPAGVAAFFAISAFLLHRPFVAARLDGRPRPSLRRFAARRVARIAPAYWVALTVLAIWPGIDGVLNSTGWKLYAFGQVYSPDTMRLGLIPAWSLDVEVVFYVLLGLVSLAASKVLAGRRDARAEYGLVALLALAYLATRLAISDDGEGAQINETLLGYLPWFLTGMAAAVLSSQRPRLAMPSWLWLGALAALLATGFTDVFDDQVALRTAQGAFGLLLCLPAFFAPGHHSGPVHALLAHPAVTWLGLISYGIFLWHYPLLGELDPGDGKGAFVLLLLLGGAATVAVAALSWRALEQPILRRVR